jgi:hypothetical protein
MATAKGVAPSSEVRFGSIRSSSNKIRRIIAFDVVKEEVMVDDVDVAGQLNENKKGGSGESGATKKRSGGGGG